MAKQMMQVVEWRLLMKCCTRFLNDETGAVTVDWVVLTAGVVVFAVFVMPPIQTAIVDMAIYIGDTVAEYHKFLDYGE